MAQLESLHALCCRQLLDARLLCQVMCDAYEPPRDTADGKHIADMKPIPTNTRHACAVAMEKAAKEEPWFGIEQVRPSSTGGRICICVLSAAQCCSDPCFLHKKRCRVQVVECNVHKACASISRLR